jgi:hypothetical protein
MTTVGMAWDMKLHDSSKSDFNAEARRSGEESGE